MLNYIYNLLNLPATSKFVRKVNYSGDRKSKRKPAYSIYLIVVLLMGCSHNTYKSVDLPFFSFQIVADSVGYVIEPDSSGGYIYFGKSVTGKYQFGYSIDNLAESEPRVVFMPLTENPMNVLDTNLVDTTDLIITHNPAFDIDRFRRQNVYFVNVDGYNAKLVAPRINGSGRVGIFIDSMEVQPGGVLQFNLFAEVRDSVEQNALLDLIKSIKFRRRNLPSY